MTKFLYLAIGSLAGGFSRYFLAESAAKNFGTGFPYGTLFVNLSGCFLIGFLSMLAEEKMSLGPHARIFLMTGFCGAFTTFSTFMLETGSLLDDRQLGPAVLNVILSVGVGFIVYRLGVQLGKII